MSKFICDVRDFGAKGDGITNDARAFNEASAYATINGGVVVAAGVFLIEGYVNFTANADLSGAVVKARGAMFSIAYSKEYETENSIEVQMPGTELMVEGCSSFKDVLGTEILERNEYSYVRVVAVAGNPVGDESAIYIYRDPKDSPSSPQGKSTSTLMNKYGRLLYSLSFDFSNVRTVSIYIRRLPNERLYFRSPIFDVESFSSAGPLLRVVRDMVDVEGFTLTRFPKISPTAYFSLVSCMNCHDVKFNNATIKGYGITNSESGVLQDVRYDFYIVNAINVMFEGLQSSTSWKTIDGNYYRGLSVQNSVVYGVHGHFGCSDITVKNCRVMTGGIAVGTGAHDSCVRVLDCVFLSVFGVAVGVRGDYGEWRGEVQIRNCQLYMSSTVPDDKVEVKILSLVETAISRNDQPGTYFLPERILIENVTVECNGVCRIIEFNKGEVYGPVRRLSAPGRIDIKGIRVRSLKRKPLIFEYSFLPFDHRVSQPVVIRIKDVENVGGVFIASVFDPSTAALPALNCDLMIESSERLQATLVMGERSTVRIRNCTVSLLDCFNRFASCLNMLEVDNSTFRFAQDFDVGNSFVVSLKNRVNCFRSCVFDASEYRSSTGAYLELRGLAHNVGDCMSIDCYGIREGQVGAGLKTIVPEPGSQSCFSTKADGTLELMVSANQQWSLSRVWSEALAWWTRIRC